MTISDADAAELADLQQRYQYVLDLAEDLTGPARAALYRKLLDLTAGPERATQEEIAEVLGVSRPRAQQLIAQARRAIR